MKSKYWLGILALIIAVCIGLILLSSSDSPAELVRVKSGSNVVTLPLSKNQEHTFTSEDGGYNTVTIRDGKIAVTAADCPDGYCMDRGFCDGGSPIVCLPHKLVIEFLGEQEIDGIIG